MTGWCGEQWDFQKQWKDNETHEPWAITNVQSIQLTQILCFYLAEGIHNSSVDESSVAGLESSLPFEKDDKMKELPTIKYDQKNVSYRKIISFLERICP